MTATASINTEIAEASELLADQDVKHLADATELEALARAICEHDSGDPYTRHTAKWGEWQDHAADMIRAMARFGLTVSLARRPQTEAKSVDPRNPAHNHDIDPSCREHIIGACMLPALADQEVPAVATPFDFNAAFKVLQEAWAPLPDLEVTIPFSAQVPIAQLPDALHFALTSATRFAAREGAVPTGTPRIVARTVDEGGVIADGAMAPHEMVVLHLAWDATRGAEA